MADFDMPPAAVGFAARGFWLVNALAAEFGLSKEQAAGIVGNLGFESGGFKELQELAPEVEGSLGGFGWAQWTGPRRRSFMAWCSGKSLQPASDEANFGYLCTELHGAYRHVIDALKNCAAVTGAVWSVGQTYERPDGTTPLHLPGYAERLAYARQALAGGHGAQEATPAATPVAQTAPQAQVASETVPPAPRERRQSTETAPGAEDDSEAEAEALNRDELGNL